MTLLEFTPMIEPTLLFSFASAIVAGIVWAVRLEGKVATHDRVFVEREIKINERHEDLKDRLVRIETKLDSFYADNHSSARLDA